MATSLDDYPVCVANIAGEHVLTAPTSTYRTVAIFDGTGSWGAGLAFAAWCSAQLGTLLARSPEESFAAVVQELERIESAVPTAFRENEFGYACAMALVLLDGREVAIAAKGSLGVLLAEGPRIDYCVRPPSWLESTLPDTFPDDARERIRRHDFRDLGVGDGSTINFEGMQRNSSGPWFGDGSGMTTRRVPFTGLGSVIVADRAVLDSLADSPETRSATMDIRALVDVAEQSRHRRPFMVHIGPKQT